MSQRYLEAPVVRRAVLAVGIALGVGLVGPTAGAAEGVDAEAEKVLRAMSSYLGGTWTTRSSTSRARSCS
jgi:hypothetical protein